MQNEHDVPMAGHHGRQTTKMVIGKKFYWPKMKKNVKHFVHTYVKCQNTKSMCKKKYGLYKPLSIPYELG
jgi:translation initiation factor 2 beta subunit (eIF-2beta)/eIF-5